MFFIAIESVLPAGWMAPHTLYAIQIVATTVAFLVFRADYGELAVPSLRRTDLAVGAVVGVLVFVLWRLLDQPWAMIGEARPIETAASAWASDPLHAIARIVGAIVLVPLIEELFWRSFLMRWLQSADFLALAPAAIGLRASLIAALLFGLEHQLIVAGVVAGLVYGELYRRLGRLWPVVIAHAVTNAMLELT